MPTFRSISVAAALVCGLVPWVRTAPAQDVLLNFDLAAVPSVAIPSGTATAVGFGLSADLLTRGPSLSGTNLARAFSSNGWITGTAGIASSYDNAVVYGQYFQFGLSVNPGSTASLQTLDLNLRRSAVDSASKFVWQYSLDGFATPGVIITSTAITIETGSAYYATGTFNYLGRNSGTPPATTTPYQWMSASTAGQDGGNPLATLSLAEIAPLQNLSGGASVQFRLYGWNNGNGAPTNTVAIGRDQGPRITGLLSSPGSGTISWAGDGVNLGGSGTWSTVAPSWYADGRNGPWLTASLGRFGGATSGTVTMRGGVVSSGGLSFDTDGYSIVAGGTAPVSLSLTGPAGANSVTVAAGTATIAVPLAGTRGLTKAGPGELILQAASTLSGTTQVDAGRLRVDNAFTTDVLTVTSGATLAGSGTVGGATTIQSGATLSPGASPGTLTFTQALAMSGGGNYNWQVYDTTGTAGSSTGWDLVSVGGALDVAATSGSPFNINLWSLSGVGPDVNGDALNFSATTSGTWRIATAAGGITGFAADKFAINVSATNGTGGFSNSLSGGTFSLAQSGNDLNLVFTAAAVGPTAVVINVPTGTTQTQGQAGYPSLTPLVATSVTKTGSGTVIFDTANTYTGTTSINEGTLRVTNGSALQSTPILVQTGGTLALPNASRLVVTATSLNVDQATGGVVDIGKGRINVAVGGITEADLRADLVAGRSGGTWSGTSGIVTTGGTAGLSTQPVVGYRVFTTGSAIVAWAAFGDSNLDGQVNLTDVSLINNGGKFGQGPSTGATWVQGDFNYSNGVTLTDIQLLNNSGLYNAGSYLPVAGLGSPGGVGLPAVASVPEPGTWALAIAGLVVLAAAGSRGQRVPRHRFLP